MSLTSTSSSRRRSGGRCFITIIFEESLAGIERNERCLDGGANEELIRIAVEAS